MYVYKINAVASDFCFYFVGMRSEAYNYSMGLKLNNDTWELGEEIGSGGFGKVFRATNGQGRVGAIKLVPKYKGAARDLLAADLSKVENVVPIIDQGETEDSWIIAMPLADKSFHDFLLERKGKVEISDVIKLAKDVATSLNELNGRVVHRDIKPQNILLLEGQWCLTDFGISRYAEATTAPDTQKYALSPPYAAPERWQNIRATTATDMYSLGVIIYEALSGTRPFSGPDIEDYREQHIQENPSRLNDIPTGLSDLIQECLYKAPASRPSPETFLKRIDKSIEPAKSGGLGALQKVNQQQVEKKMSAQREEIAKNETLLSRAQIAQSARLEFDRIATSLKQEILENAPAAQILHSPGQEWRIKLGEAQLDFNDYETYNNDNWGRWDSPGMDVVAFSSIDISMPVNGVGYEGRGHSLWYCDAQKRGEFGWYEVAFMVSAIIPRAMPGNNGGIRDPFQLNPSEQAAKALSSAMTEFQLARPFILLKDDSVNDFINRWAGYLASAVDGSLNRPSTMPELSPDGSWTR